MTLEQKELLLKDLCARLPYSVKVEYDKCACEILSIDRFHEELTIWKCAGCYPDIELENAKPYLFPMSSMTEWQERELEILMKNSIESCGMLSPYDCLEMERFFNENHIDWRGLIPMGLSLDATGLNIY